MAECSFTFGLSFDSTIESLLLIKIHVESQIVCFKMHQRGSVKQGNMGIGKIFLSINDGNMGHFKPFENDLYSPH